MPIPIVPILLFIVIAIISSAAKAKEQQRRQQQAAQQRRQAYPPVHTAPASSAAPAPAPASPAPRPVPQETEAQRRARQDELKRRLEENRRRREQELKRADQQRADQQRAEEQRSRLEKRPMVTTIQTARTEKPVIAHEDDDCGGGSIHDGYHEGVTQFPNGRPAAVAGRLGNRLADEDERIERERVSAENARRVMKRISKLPPLAQGMIYSEILGKPKSEIA